MLIVDRKSKIAILRRGSDELAYLSPDIFRLATSAVDIKTLPRPSAENDVRKVVARLGGDMQARIATDDTDEGAWYAAAVAAQLRAFGYSGECGWQPHFYLRPQDRSVPVPRWRAEAYERTWMLISASRAKTAKLATEMYRGGAFRASPLGILMLLHLLAAARKDFRVAHIATPFGEVYARVTGNDLAVEKMTLTTHVQVDHLGAPDFWSALQVAFDSMGAHPEKTLNGLTQLFDMGLISCPIDATGSLRPSAATAARGALRNLLPGDLSPEEFPVDEFGRALFITPEGRGTALPQFVTKLYSTIYGLWLASQAVRSPRTAARYRFGETEIDIPCATTTGQDRVLATTTPLTYAPLLSPAAAPTKVLRSGEGFGYIELLRKASFVRDPRWVLQEVADLVKHGLMSDTGLGWKITVAGAVFVRDMLSRNFEFSDGDFVRNLFRRADGVRDGRPDVDFVPHVQQWLRTRFRPKGAIPKSIGTGECGHPLVPRALLGDMEAYCAKCSALYAVSLEKGRVKCARV